MNFTEDLRACARLAAPAVARRVRGLGLACGSVAAWLARRG
jgi:hypothetical protein